ncbi:ArsR family transcriptional regulator [Janthinobacterium sp. DSP2-3-3]|uniref:ArsR family transcriptional regulator n=1 Tax=Janthinobacterium sp. DSP2-3-3 TaxID=2804596 RepID=UPI003CEEF7EA
MSGRHARVSEVSAHRAMWLLTLSPIAVPSPRCCAWAHPIAGDGASPRCCAVTHYCRHHASFQFIHAKIWRMIAQALFTPAQQKLLGLLFVRVNEGFHLNEIMRLTGLGSASAQRELRRLHESGLITSERIGNVRRFWPNKESLVYPELSALVQKTFGIVGVLSATLAPLRAQLHLAFVSGATAKGQDMPGSAIDLLLVGEEANYGDLLTGLAPAERTLRRKINPNLYTLADYRRRLREGQPFLLQVLQQPKLFVIGDESLLHALALPDSSLQVNDTPSVF